jgi:hypothetical protein
MMAMLKRFSLLLALTLTAVTGFAQTRSAGRAAPSPAVRAAPSPTTPAPATPAPAAPAAPVPDRLPDTYQIYSLLMPGQVFLDMDSGQNQPWAISATTVNEDDIDPKLAPEAFLQPPAENAHGFREAVNDYNQRKKERLVLKRRFQLSRPYVLLSANDTAQFRASRTSLNATSSMRSAFGNYLGITYFSEVYFNVAQTSALVYILDWCGNLCSQAVWVYLEKQDGVWVLRSGKAPPQT